MAELASRSSPPAPSVLMVVTEDWYFLSHRLDLARGLRDAGYSIHVATAPGAMREVIEAEGFGYSPLRMVRRGMQPWREWLSVRDLTEVMRDVRPTLAHLVGMKPMVYGCLAARRAGVPAIVCAVAGMGYAFLPGGWSKRLIRAGIRQVFRHSVAGRADARVIVQNADDRQLLVQTRMANIDQIAIVCGAGVDLRRFTPRPFPTGEPVVLAHCRLLWDKGIGELAEAARLLRERGVAGKIVLVGTPDDANPASISETQLNDWVREGLFDWRGRRDDIPEQLAGCHIACLPSYREGAPLSLIEAAACGRPIVTTNVPGCREVVKHGDNGLLVPPRDAVALADALQSLMQDSSLRQRMGQRSRFWAEERFDRSLVLQETLRLYEELLPVGLRTQSGPLADSPTTMKERAA